MKSRETPESIKTEQYEDELVSDPDLILPKLSTLQQIKLENQRKIDKLKNEIRLLQNYNATTNSKILSQKEKLLSIRSNISSKNEIYSRLVENSQAVIPHFRQLESDKAKLESQHRANQDSIDKNYVRVDTIN